MLNGNVPWEIQQPSTTGGGGGGSNTIDVRKNGVTINATATFLNFIGTPVAVAVNGTGVNITVSAAASPWIATPAGNPATAPISGASNALAFGNQTKAGGQSSIAIGDAATANDSGGNYAIAIGTSPTARNDNSIAIGFNTIASIGGTTGSSIAIGPAAVAYNDYSIAIGPAATTTNAVRGIAIGQGATGEGDSVTIGFGANTTGGPGSVALGSATSNGYFGVAVGYSAFTTTQSVAIGRNASCSGFLSVSIGNAATSNSNYVVCLGANAAASGDASVAIGTNAGTGATQVVAVGTGAYATGGGNAFGQYSTANITGVAVGPSATATGDPTFFVGAIAIGPTTSASAANSVALATQSQTLNKNEIAKTHYSSTNGVTSYQRFQSLSVKTTDGTPTALNTYSTNAADTALALPASSGVTAATFVGTVMGCQIGLGAPSTGSVGDTIAWKIEGCYKNTGIYSLVGVPVITPLAADAGMGALSVNITTTADGLQIVVTGENGRIMRWSAQLTTNQTQFV